jgi:serine/threonine protein kinase/tetratricopeptide (TPR) repeat protein
MTLPTPPSEPSRLVKELFLQALELDAARRLEFVAGIEDLKVRSEVEKLLGACQEADSGGFLAGPTIDAIESRPPGPSAPPREIGPYRLLQRVGEGGFGEVFLAEQTSPVRRRVALKLIKPGMDSRQVIARFEAERQALAMMEHPNIARVFDAGTTDAGRPYFVMELVNGVPITDFCDQQKLTPRERIELLVPICQAVQHAHQKGIIHRDLKPGNILVTLHDGTPVPKVIDFGVAKATQARLTEKTLFTEFRQMIGTPEYMPPEQAEMSGLDVDTRSDVYSLGVVLYELLAGVPPFDPKELRSKAFAEMQRVIREVDPPRPSTRLVQSESRASIAALRSVEPARLGTMLRGELDWIVMKCLEKDRSRRYESAAALARDLSRHLAGEAVEAHPPSVSYRLVKAFRKHRVALLTAAVVMLALAGGLVTALWGLKRAQLERDAAVEARSAAEVARQAEAEAREYERETDRFLLQMFESIEPENAQGKPILVRDILDQATAQISREPPSHPIVEASLRYTFGKAYHSLAVYDQAEAELRRSLELYTSSKGEKDRSTVNAMIALGAAWYARRDDRAIPLMEKALPLCAEAFGADSEALLALENNLAEAYRNAGRMADADAILVRSLERAERISGKDSLDVMMLRNTLANVRETQGRFEEAHRLLREALDVANRRLGKSHPHTAAIMSNLGNSLRSAGYMAEAEPLLRDALEAARAAYGPEHASALTVASNLGLVLSNLGKFDESESLYRQVIEARTRLLGASHQSTLLAKANYGLMLEAKGDLVAAEGVYRDVAEVARQSMSPDHIDAMSFESNLAWVAMKLGRLDEAEGVFRDLLARAIRVAGDESFPAMSFRTRLALTLVLNGKAAEALPIAERGWELAQQRKIASLQVGYSASYGAALLKTGDAHRGIEFLRKADEILERHPRPDPKMRRQIWQWLAEGYHAVGNQEQALHWSEKAEKAGKGIDLTAAPASSPSSAPAR